MHEAEIDVLLATCDGEQFLEQQLNSLFSQTFQSFRLIVRDDCSTDSTLQIVEHFRSRYPDFIEVHRNAARHGACRNFSLLAEQSTAPYFAFCDQDDIWRPNKLELSLTTLKRAEDRHGIDTPALVFTNVALVDGRAKVISPSLWRAVHVFPERVTFGSQLVQNLVTGCTILGNRSLLKLGNPVGDDAMMHDYWFGLVATAFGVVCPLRNITVDYRQHRHNAIGAQFGPLTRKIAQLWSDPDLKEYMAASQKQARGFASRYASLLSAEQKTIIEVWSGSQRQMAPVRQWELYRHGLRRTGFLNNLGFMLRAW
jgi:glycosyltransferase involved in cell wall biosynthesis